MLQRSNGRKTQLKSKNTNENTNEVQQFETVKGKYGSAKEMQSREVVPAIVDAEKFHIDGTLPKSWL